MGDSTTDYRLDKGHSPGLGRNYLREYMDFHGPAPGRNYWHEYGVGPLVPPKPSEPPDEPGVFDEFGSAFHHSLIQSNPEMYGAALEAAGVSSASESMRQAGERLQRWAAGLEAGRPPITFEEAEGFGENLRALAGLTGSAFGSTVPPLVMGAAGAVGGAAVAGPPGALAGGFIGAAAAGAPLNLGEAYQQFKQEGVEPERAAKFAIAIAVPITALDAGGLGRIVSRSLGAPIKKTVLRTIGRRIAEGSLIEGSTEALQSAIREATAAALTDNPDVSRRAWRTFEEALAGAMVGGTIGGVTTTADQLLRPQDTAPPPLPPERPTPPPDSGRPGAAETAAAGAAGQPLSEADLASPLPDNLIAEGREFMATAEGATESNQILAEYGLPNVGEQAIYQSDVVSEDGRVSRSTPERVVVLDAIPSEEYMPGESTPPAVKIWRDGTTFELILPLSGETLTAPPTAQQQAEQADRTRFEADVAETLRPLDTPELRNAALRAELDAEGAESLEALGPERRSKLLGTLKKRVATDTTTRESESQAAAGEQQESDEQLLFDEEYQEAVSTAAGKIGPERAQGLVAETTEAMGLAEGAVPTERRAAFLKLLKAKARTASRLVQQEPQQQPETQQPQQPELLQQQPEPLQPGPEPQLPQQPEAQQPQPQSVQEIPFQPVERDKAITPAGTEHEVEYAIADADTLTASHDRFGNLNPAYPQELQPRDRSRAASQLQIEQLSRDLRPQLLDRSPGAESGAPIIDPGGVVESGNARTIALQTAYSEGTAENYRQYLAGKGYPVEGIGKPVLVRIRRSQLTPGERLAFTREANQQAVMSLSRTERAFADAEAMPRGLVGLYEGGAVDLAKNRNFVRSFVRDVVGPGEQTTFVSAQGDLTADGVQRIETAMLAKAYSDRRLVERIAEAADPGRRTIRNVLIDLAPQWAAMRESVQADTMHPDIDQTKALLDAVNLIDRGVRERVLVSDLLNQGSLFPEGDQAPSGQHGERVKAFLGMFYKDPGADGYKRLESEAGITEALRRYLQSAERYDPRQATLLGEGEAPPIERMLRGARSEEPATEPELPTEASPATAPAAPVETPAEPAKTKQSKQPKKPKKLKKTSRAKKKTTQRESTKAPPESESRPAPEAAVAERTLTAEEAAWFAKLPEILAAALNRIAPNTTFKASQAPISGSRGFVQGRYRPYNSVIEVALDPGFGTSNPLKVLHHEAIHALQADGLFTEAEWNTLTREAQEQNWIARYRIEERYPELFEKGKPSEAATGEAIADAFADWSAAPRGWRETVARIFAKLRRLLRQLRSALLKSGWQTSAEDIFSRVRSGEVGTRTPTITPQQGAVRESRPEAGESRRRAEERFKERQKGLRASGPSMVERAREAWENFREDWVRTYRDLPRKPLFADAHEWLRSLQAAPSVASGEAERHLTELTEGINAERLDLMTRKVFMDDFYDDIREGMAVPFWSSTDDFMASYREVNKAMQADRELASRVRKRQAYVRRVARRMVDAGVLSPERLKRRNYIKHQVIEYAQTIRSSRVRGVRKPKWARRMGTTLEINTNLLEAESAWLMKALVDIQMAKVITQIAESPQYNHRGELKKAIREHNKPLVDQLVVGEFREALRLAGVDRSLADAIETPADIGEFLKENSEDIDRAKLKTPIRNQLRGFRKNIGAGFGKLRATLDKADVPSHLEAEYTLLMDTERVTESTEDSAFPLVVWVVQNLDGEAAGAAYRILGAVTARRQFLKDQLGEKYILADNMEKALKAIRRGGGTEWEGFESWQPDPGRHMFTALTIPEHVFDRMRSKLAEVFEDSGMAGMFPAGEVAAMMDRIKEQRVVGGPKFEMVVPVELAATLDSFGSKDSDYYATVELYEKSIRAWKQWTLINPRRYFKYNLQNTSGDLDGVIAAFPKALKWKYLKPAFLELWDVTVRKGTPSAVFQEAAERGVLDGGWSISEVYDVQNDIEGLLVKPGLSERTLRKIWKFLAKSTTFRENFLRYAMYLAVREEIQTARQENPGRLNEDLMPLVGYGAGRIDQVNAITSDADRAAYIARESLGDYGAISVLGQKLRKWVIPFWSWQEINAKRYYRIGSNIVATQKGFGRAASLAALGAKVGTRAALWLTWRLMVYSVGTWMWNNLLFPDLEEELRDEDRRRLHLILGKSDDGEIIMLRMPGALSDLMGWFGYDDVLAALSHISKGRGTWRDVALAVVQAPISRLVNGLTPTFKVPGEALAGRSFFPDVFNPRLIRDGWRHLFRAVQVEPVYVWWLGRPSPGAGHVLMTTFVDARHTGYSAYAKIRGEAYQWLRAVEGEEGAPLYASRRGNAYFYYRMALKFKDTEAAVRYRQELRRLKVKPDMMRAMLKRAHPLGMLTIRERRAFLRTLTPTEERSLERAIKWWKETYVGGHKQARRD